MSEKYRPSNGTEGEGFINKWCGNCQRDKFQNGTKSAYECGDEDLCSIIGKTMFMEIDDPDYPTEWIKDESGPRCTAFLPIETRKPETMTKTLTPFQNWWADLVEGFDPESVEVEELAKLAFEAGQAKPTLSGAPFAYWHEMIGEPGENSFGTLSLQSSNPWEDWSAERKAKHAYTCLPLYTPQQQPCTCPSGDGSLRWPCPTHPPASEPDGWLDKLMELADSYAVAAACAVTAGVADSQENNEEKARAKLLEFASTQPAVPDGMALVPERLSRQHIGQIVDDVFDGALEDASVISDIWVAGIAAAKEQP